MERFLEFVKNHWTLWLALVVLLILLFFEELRDRFSGIQRLSPQALTQMINRDEVAVVDIRDRNAFDQGHIIGSMNIEMPELEKNMSRLEKYKDKGIVIIDGANQSSLIAAKLQKAGYKIYTLTGGLNAWKNLGMPLTKK